MAILENIQNSQVVRAYRQGYLAWLGAHKAAFDMTQEGISKLMNSREEVVADLVEKGEAVEADVQTRVNGFFGRAS